MSRLFLATVGLALILPAVGLAESKKKPDVRKASTSEVLPPIAYGEAKPAGYAVRPPGPIPVSATGCPNGTCNGAGGPAAGGSFGTRLGYALLDENHNCAPDGCPKPIGCGNFWTEWKFIFGSCRQFFGTAGATTGTHRSTVEDP
ncbi:MAG TPA: hypothetical protein VKE74_13970 [Gemmataceae bacterium]|nr:hypothetical protein [Gemmataceae bacterium]